MNKSHLEAGRLAKMEQAPKPPEPSPNQLSDKEIDDLLDARFTTLKKQSRKIDRCSPSIKDS
jgi:hypothetical protein